LNIDLAFQRLAIFDCLVIGFLGIASNDCVGLVISEQQVVQPLLRCDQVGLGQDVLCKRRLCEAGQRPLHGPSPSFPFTVSTMPPACQVNVADWMARTVPVAPTIAEISAPRHFGLVRVAGNTTARP
jgi:hypothetical protein